MTEAASHPFPEPDRCPKCKTGIVLECNFGWWCSRRYEAMNPCDWEQGDPGPSPEARKPDPGHAKHVRKHRRAIYRPHGALDPRRCDACGVVICCAYGQRAVMDPRAPGGVWVLHPACKPPSAKERRS